MRARALKIDTRQQALAELKDWRVLPDRDAITRTFHFPSFRDAWHFMSDVAVVVDQMDHHPEWTNIDNRVEVILTTHDAGGLTERDFELAREMDSLAGDAE